MKFGVRKLDLDDAAKIVSWITDERALLVWGGPYFDFPLTIEAVSKLISEHDGEKPARECWAIDLPEGEFVASFQLSLNFRSGQAGLGRVIINPDFRGSGLAKQILRIAERKAFDRLEMNRLELRVFTFNVAAIAAYKNAGFVYEGTARQSARFGSECWDTMIMSKLRSESST